MYKVLLTRTEPSARVQLVFLPFNLIIYFTSVSSSVFFSINKNFVLYFLMSNYFLLA